MINDEILWLKAHYNVTIDGRVIRICDGKEFVSCLDKKGYKRLRIPSKYSTHKDGMKTYKVHRLVAMYYLEDYSPDLQVNHKNGDKADNRVENLEMVTNRENVIHAWRILDKRQRLAKLNSHRNPKTGRFDVAQSI